MLLLSLSGGARSGVVEVVFPTKARGLKCLGIEWEADFHVSINLSSFLYTHLSCLLSQEGVFPPSSHHMRLFQS